MSPTYRLERAARPLLEAPALDEEQRAVVEHPCGPLLVLAGPGTGKTTTLVESVVHRIEERGLSPDEVLVLTFSRKAADEVRDRITRRLGRTSATMLSATFHSFCYALLRRYQPADLYVDPLRLLSAPEQDVKLHELLAHSRESRQAGWPSALDQALRTRGFAREVHAVLSRARELGMDPAELSRVGQESDRPAWTAAGDFMEEYLTVLDFEGALDYSELIHRAVLRAETDEVKAALREQYKVVFVDEYQDTDPSQVRLLHALVGPGRDLVVVGDPDQSIYGFRGAEVRGILDFPTAFPRSDGKPADVVALQTARRFGPRLLTASRRIAAGIAVKGSIDQATFEAFRHPQAERGPLGDGRVDVRTFSSSGAETDHIADMLRRAHLEDGVDWSDMAVLVRSGLTSLPGLRRALVSAGVPVEVAGDEVPLRAEPAVQPLLLALRSADDIDSISVDTARMLLMSPLGDLDASQVRQLGRLLRARDREELRGERLPRPSAKLLRLSLVDVGFLAGLEGPLVARARLLAQLLAQASRVLAAGGAAEEALWVLWSGTRWPRRLRRQVSAGGVTARTANRDLDAICALFELAARAEEKRDHTGATVFLDEVEAQQLPADTLAERGVRGDAVRLLTAHRSKGLEWRLVVIAGVQEGAWPDLRRRGSLLQADLLGRDGLAEPRGNGAMLAEERRLFYVATTRARQRLIVTAVASPEADGDQPSRFLQDLGLPVVAVPGRPARPMSLAGLVSELRRVAADPAAASALRRSAAARLARLAEERINDEPVAAAADPGTWWGLRERTASETPVRPLDLPLSLSASALGSILDCPLRWFLAREAGGESARSTSLGFGSVLHALADHMAKGESVDGATLRELLDSVWHQLEFESPWIAARERVEADKAIDRFVQWHRGRPHREYLGSEVPFEVEVALEGSESVSLRGKLDRLERDDAGNVVVVDFKTSKNPPPESSLPQDPQLGLYQLVVAHGGLAAHVGPEAVSGGAELVQLRVDAPGGPKVQVQSPQLVDDSGRTPVEIQLISASEALRSEDFVATANSHCNFCEFAALCPARRRSATVLS